MSEKLKSCPFCGGEAMLGGDSDTCWWVFCQKCNVETLTFSGRQIEGAIAVWNNRPGEATARLTAFEEGEQATIAFLQSHYWDNYPDDEVRKEKCECLEKDVANAFQILKEKP